jgi:hypothetical protein
MSYQTMSEVDVLRTAVRVIQDTIRGTDPKTPLGIEVVMAMWGVSMSFRLKPPGPPTPQESSQLLIRSAVGDIMNALSVEPRTVRALKDIHSAMVRELLPDDEQFAELQVVDAIEVDMTVETDQERWLHPLVRHLFLSIDPDKLQYTTEHVESLDTLTTFFSELNMRVNDPGTKRNRSPQLIEAHRQFHQWASSKLLSGQLSALNAAVLMNTTVMAPAVSTPLNVERIQVLLDSLMHWQQELVLDALTHTVLCTYNRFDWEEAFTLVRTVECGELSGALFAALVSAGEDFPVVMRNRTNYRGALETIQRLT